MTDDTDASQTEATDDSARRPEDAASPAKVERLARQYTAEGRPFARVTVVRREPPVSATVGDRALVTSDGELVGWVGGAACARSVAIREAVNALETGTPTLIGLAPDPASIDRPGLASFPMTCHSKGTIELFVEPITPPPRLVVVGDSPAARALSHLAGELTYEVTTVPEPDTSALLADDAVETLAIELEGASWVTVASMGSFDDVAVEAALVAGVPYVGLVASKRRAEKLCTRLAERLGRDPDAVRAAVTSPAGLDIGAETPEEVAVSILAELVSVKRPRDTRGEAPKADSTPATDSALASDSTPATDSATEKSSPDGSVPDAVAAPTPEMAIDPVCGMDVTVGEAAAIVDHDGKTYHFCGQGCADAFVDDPERFFESVES